MGELCEVGLLDSEDATRLVLRVVGGEQDRSSRAGEADAARDPHEWLGLPTPMGNLDLGSPVRSGLPWHGGGMNCSG
jgi:hypothetical protein